MDHLSHEGLILSDSVKQELKHLAKWAKLLAVIGFIICGLIFLFIVVAGVILIAYSFFGTGTSALSETKPWITTPVYLLITALCFIPCLMLYNFSVKTGEAIRRRSDEALVKAFASLHKCFRFVGIITITIIGLYAIVRIGIWIAYLSELLFG